MPENWIVLDPEPDTTIRSGFSTHIEAVDWVAEQRALYPDDEAWWRCVIAPYDPERPT